MRSLLQLVVGTWLISSVALMMVAVLADVREGGGVIPWAERLPEAAVFLVSAGIAAVVWLRVRPRRSMWARGFPIEPLRKDDGANGEVKNR